MTYYISNFRNHVAHNIAKIQSILVVAMFATICLGLRINPTYADITPWMSPASAITYLRKIKGTNMYPSKITCKEDTKSKTGVAKIRFSISKNSKKKNWKYMITTRNTTLKTWRVIYDIKGMNIISFSQFQRLKSGLHVKCFIGVSR